MLTRHETKSKRRMLAGAVATAALTIGGLGLTASGTQAAETVRTSMESAVGVDLASLELPSLPQSEPLPPPPAPPVPPTPPVAPDAPDAPAMKKHVRIIMRDKDGKMTAFDDADGKPGHRVEQHRYVFRGKDGKPAVWESGMPLEVRAHLKDMRIELRNMPEVSSRDCKDGEGKAGEHVINRKDGDKRITIICTNRIERMASLAALDAREARARSLLFQRSPEATALDSLRFARRSIESNRGLAESARSAALSGIDDAIREMEDKKDDRRED